MNPEENITNSVSRTNVQSPNPTPQETVPSVKIGKFKASRMIVRESFEVLKKDRELAWFPVFSTIASLTALVILGTLFFFSVMSGSLDGLDKMSERGTDVFGYIILFIYYLVMFLITNYFLAGMYIIINARFNGQDLSFRDGIKGASENFGKIFLWSLISATVGVILQIISNKSKLVGKIIASIFGAVWNILTYFSLPSLIIGKTSVRESFKESASIIRKMWGETIIINFGVGLVFGLLAFGGIVVSIGFLVLVPVDGILILVAVLLILYFIALTIISSTLSAIFKLAIYQYAKTGVVPQGFTPALIQNAVQTGK